MSIAFCSGPDSDAARRSGSYSYLTEEIKEHLEGIVDFDISLLTNISPYEVTRIDNGEAAELLKICRRILDSINQAGQDDHSAAAREFLISFLPIGQRSLQHKEFLFAIGD